MEYILEENKCCGCQACANICPKNAITMQENEKGFLYPSIDQDKCINCGACKQACPVLNKKEEVEKDIATYACYNKNLQERLNSSSGGMFILLAKEIIRKGGVVFGAAFDENFNVKHTYADNEKDLIKFMGSKYTQSDIGNTYKEAKKFLEQDRVVLFSGTPCQIEGLKAYLKKDYDKLYTQDIICHGVPSPKVWRKYLDYQKELNNEDIKSVSFRNKDHGWSLFRMKISFDTKAYSENHNEDLYMKSFLKNICLRDSCYECSFKKKYRISDITLADFWGIDKIYPNMNDDKGISLILLNSAKGKELFGEIKKNIEYREVELDIAAKYNSALTESAKHCVNEKEFLENVDNLDFDKLVNKYVPKTPLEKRIKNIIKKIIKI